jgi:hypothetical protein
MIPNKYLLAYFYQEQNIRRLEELIDEVIECKRSCKEPQTAEELEAYVRNCREITSNDEANDLVNKLIYPKIQEFSAVKDIRKPKAIVLGKNFISNTINFQRDSVKYLALGFFTISPITLTLGANIPEAVTMPLILPFINTFKGLFQYRDAGGCTDPIFKINAYVKSDRVHRFFYALTHEITHCIQGQKTNFLSNLVQGYTGRYSLYVEGTAELVTQEVSKTVDGGIWNNFKTNHALSRSYSRLLNSYYKLCSHLGISENKKRFKKNSEVPEDVYSCNMYDAGYSIMALLRKERGDEIFNELLTNQFKL